MSSIRIILLAVAMCVSAAPASALCMATARAVICSDLPDMPPPFEEPEADDEQSDQDDRRDRFGEPLLSS